MTENSAYSLLSFLQCDALLVSRSWPLTDGGRLGCFETSPNGPRLFMALPLQQFLEGHAATLGVEDGAAKAEAGFAQQAQHALVVVVGVHPEAMEA